MNRARVGKSRTVQGAEMFSRRNIRLHVRWNIRSENGPCSRVTWLWYSSTGLIARDPNSSSTANGLKTDVRRIRRDAAAMPGIVATGGGGSTPRQKSYK